LASYLPNFREKGNSDDHAAPSARAPRISPRTGITHHLSKRHWAKPYRATAVFFPEFPG
jgi:hypothetical protein